MFDHQKSRPVTSELLDLAEQGVLDWESLARDCLGWMSESEVAEFARRNDYIQDEDKEDHEYDGQPDEAQEWHDFDPDC